MFRLNVRDHFMIAHSFKGEVFGPARNLHGATYVVDLEVHRPDLDPDGVVTDIGKLAGLLEEIVGKLDYRNLDQAAEFKGVNTTTEELARWIAHRVSERIDRDALGGDAREAITGVRVTLNESHIAWASYELERGG
jgi:6-pyruvoyl-tetrahydropterin synthase